METSKAITIVIALLLAPGLLVAQDVTGLWDVQASFTFPQEQPTVAAPPDCEYEGTGIPLVQNGTSVTGTVDLNLTSSRSEVCPGEIISGSLDATLTGSTFDGTLTGSKLLGSAEVSGSIAGVPRHSSAAAAAATMSGTAAVSGGNFPGSAGSFSGQQLPAMPTMGAAAIAVLALILFGGTVLLLTRRSRVSV